MVVRGGLLLTNMVLSSRERLLSISMKQLCYWLCKKSTQKVALDAMGGFKDAQHVCAALICKYNHRSYTPDNIVIIVLNALSIVLYCCLFHLHFKLFTLYVIEDKRIKK